MKRPHNHHAICVSVCIGLLCAAPLFAQSKLETYRKQALRIAPGIYTAFDLERLDGTKVPFGHYGDELEHVFQGSNEALKAAQRFRDMRIAGTALNVAGLALLLSELVLILVGHDAVINPNASGAEGLRPLTFALLGGGLALNIGGILLEVSSLQSLDAAVRHHNTRTLRQLDTGAKLEVKVGF